MFTTFLVLAKGTNEMANLYTIEMCQSYYLFTFMGLNAVSYVIDTNNRKEAGFLMLFAVPFYITAYLFICMLIGEVIFPMIAVMILIMSLVFFGAYLIYKYIMPKILMIKNGYQTISFIYMIVVLTIVLFICFSLMS